MCEVTKRAVIALLAADDTATDDERERVAMAVKGVVAPYTITDAAGRLGVSRPTLYSMLRAGILQRLPDGRVDARSVADYLTNRQKQQEER